MEEQERLDEFEDRKAPYRWTMSAERLKRSAEILFAHTEAHFEDGEPVNIEDCCLGVHTSAQLLLGYAVELAIKGYLLQKGLKTFGEITKGDLANHNLESQFRMTKLQCSPERLWLLRQLTQYILWAGRYPLPRSSDKFKPLPICAADFDVTNELLPIQFTGEECSQTFALIDELVALSV
jgi:hypothetical protein